jgi:hypothetical protein
MTGNVTFGRLKPWQFAEGISFSGGSNTVPTSAIAGTLVMKSDWF